MLKIRELREELGITQKKLADAIGNMQRNVSNWEQGVIEPDLATVVALADYFGVTLDELFGREEAAHSLDSKITNEVRRMTVEQKQALYYLLNSHREQ